MQNPWTRISRTAMVVVCALLLGAVALEAQRGGGGRGGGGIGGPGRGGIDPAVQPPPAPRGDQDLPQPTFRSGITVVQVDAIVTDADGQPVRGLTADDFEVFEARQPRDIVAFAAIDMPLPSPSPVADDARGDVVSNTGPPGRTYLIALDEVAPDRALRARAMLRRFIDTSLGPGDVVGVALTGRGLSNSGQDFTGDRRLVLNAIDRFTGGFEAAGTARSTTPAPQLAASLRTLTEFLATMPGRKVLIFVAEGLGGLDPYAATEYRGGALTPAQHDMHAAVAAATRGNVTIYPLDPSGVTTELSEAESFESPTLEARADLAALADVTGGFAIVGSNSIPAALQRVVQENSTYYTLGFASPYDRTDGRFVPLAVRVKRPGLQVRARNGYVAPIGRSRTPEIRADARNPSVANAIASPVAIDTIPMRIAAASYRAGGRNASVVLAIELDASRLDLVEKDGTLTGELELSYLATDASGRVRPGRRHNAVVTLAANAARPGEARWIRLVSAFELQRGRYQLRVAAGAGSRAGSVVYDLEVPDFGAGPLALSHVAVTSSTAARLQTLRLRDPLTDVLPAPPVATREFAADETLAVYTESYRTGRRDAAPPEVTVELRRRDGGVARTASEHTSTEPVHGGQGGRGTMTYIPLTGLPAGEYVLHIEARPGGGDDAVRRVIPLTIREVP